MSAKPDMSVPTGASGAPLRPISFGNPAVTVERRHDGTIYLRPKTPLGDYPVRLTDRLHHWASAEPNRVFMAERDATRGWQQITYAQLLESSRRMASALLARGLSAERPIVILSGNSIDESQVEFCFFNAGRAYCIGSPDQSDGIPVLVKAERDQKLLTPG